MVSSLFYGPVVVGVLAIWILFLFIAKVIITASKTKAKQKGDSDLVLRRRQLQSALAVSALLGLGWIVGFFLLLDTPNYSQVGAAFRWAFILLNAPQGMFLFLFYAVMNKKVRNYWLYKLTCGKQGTPEKSVAVSVSTAAHSTIMSDGVHVHVSDHPRSPVHVRATHMHHVPRTPSPCAAKRMRSPSPANRSRTPSNSIPVPGASNMGHKTSLSVPNQ